MTVQRTLAFNPEELEIIKNFSEKIHKKICDELSCGDCIVCPFNAYCEQFEYFLNASYKNKQYVLDVTEQIV